MLPPNKNRKPFFKKNTEVFPLECPCPAEDQLLAEQIPYDNTVSELTATDVQAAIDELDSLIDTINTNIEPAPGSISVDSISEQTTGAGVTVDGALIKDGGVSNSGETVFAGFYPVTSPQESPSGPGALAIGSYHSAWTSTGTGDALTLANGTMPGRLKKITYVAEAAGADTGILTPTTPSGFSSIVFNAIGDYVLLMWTSAGYKILEHSGVTVNL